MLAQLHTLLHQSNRVRGGYNRLKGGVSRTFQRRLAAARPPPRVGRRRAGGRRWRADEASHGAKLLKRGGTLRTVPEAFVYDGSNYLLKMLVDLDAMRSPAAPTPS